MDLMRNGNVHRLKGTFYSEHVGMSLLLFSCQNGDDSDRWEVVEPSSTKRVLAFRACSGVGICYIVRYANRGVAICYIVRYAYRKIQMQVVGVTIIDRVLHQT